MGMNVNSSLREALKKLDMDDIHSLGLKWIHEKDNEQNPYVYLALEQADAFGAIAVYFRFFDDDRCPRPQIYIYSFDNIGGMENDGANIHHSLWNAGIVPYCFIFKPSEILVYNCGRKPDVDNDGEEFITSPHDTINLLGDVQEKLHTYSARQFDSGLFWETDAGKNFKYEQSAYEQLLIQLKNVKTNIISRVGKEQSSLIKRVLMMLILIKYLEERKDEHNKGALNPEVFYKEFNSKEPSLAGALCDVDTFAAVLAKLSSREHFNGQIFFLNEQERVSLKEIDLTVFRHFVEGDTMFFSSANHGIGQMSLWRLYQFNYLPIELISHIYEDFLADENGRKKNGVVYTPPYLVQFLIDRCMPLNHPKSDFKILDPACGSGIFLVGAFKRMIQWWRVQNNWKKPQKENIEGLKQLLLKNIFGCDLEPEAVTLSYFSLGLALLDALSPKEIWNNVHFDNLVGGNLIAGDFFESLEKSILPTDFDLVIGNPPFESKFTTAAIRVDSAEKSSNPKRPDVPDTQIALLFLDQSFKLLKTGGSCCLILPSGPVLYNSKTHGFKKYLFHSNYFKEIYDFTALRAKLFIGSSSSAKPAVVAVFAEKQIPEGKPVYHFIFRRTRASGEKIEFEIDHYDIHRVAYKAAVNMPSVWQANFMGSGRLQHLVDRVSKHSNLGNYLKDMKHKRSWVFGEGWQECPNSKPLLQITNLLKIADRNPTQDDELKTLESKHKADWITDQKLITTDGSIEICKKVYFQWPRKEDLFKPPHLLVHESVKDGIIPAIYSEDYMTFKDSLFGIHAPEEDKTLLQDIRNYLGNSLNVALIWLNSGKIITMREGVPLMSDILSLPYPQLEFDAVEKILLADISIYYSDFRKEGEKSSILSRVTEEDLKSFGEIYCLIFNSVFKNLKALNPIVDSEFIAFPFVLGDEPETNIPDSLTGIEKKLNLLIDNKRSNNLWIRRIVKVYHKNVIFLYKPNQKRYWLKSVAIRDADETFVDLYKQGK